MKSRKPAWAWTWLLLWHFCGRQGKKEQPSQEFAIYGELGLDGSVFAPADVELGGHGALPLLTGMPRQKSSCDLYYYEHLNGEINLQKKSSKSIFLRPECPPYKFKKEIAEQLSVAALGNHSVLLAGPAGTGKNDFL